MAFTFTRDPPRYAPVESIAAAFEDRATLAAATEALAARSAEADTRAAPADTAIERLHGMDRAFNRMIAAGCDNQTASMMVLAVLSSSPQTREDCRAWCVEHLSTRDDPTGTNMTKIVPSVPARRQ